MKPYAVEGFLRRKQFITRATTSPPSSSSLPPPPPPPPTWNKIIQIDSSSDDESQPLATTSTSFGQQQTMPTQVPLKTEKGEKDTSTVTLDSLTNQSDSNSSFTVCQQKVNNMIQLALYKCMGPECHYITNNAANWKLHTMIT